MDTPFSTRLLEAREAPLLLDLFVELEQYYFGEAASHAQLRVYLEEGLFGEDSSVRVLGAFEGEELLGFATFAILHPAPRRSGQAYIKDLFTAQRARGRGVGRLLMQRLAQIALERGCSRLDWTAESDNPGASSFYQALGARQVVEKQYFRFEGPELQRFAQGEKSPEE